jgi:hypothetical protein
MEVLDQHFSLDEFSFLDSQDNSRWVLICHL